VVGTIIAIAVMALLAWFAWRSYRRHSLQHRYGPEYARAVHDYGSDDRAVSALEKREERLRKYRLRALSRREQEQFAVKWRNTQARFVDDPRGSVREADQLMCQVMETRGYPMADFERRAEDLSVQYPRVVDNYRAAHRIALADVDGKASTEDLRRAFVCYRELFADLLDSDKQTARDEVHA
jgi:hypothetical protein